MTPETIELGRRAVACKAWRWMPGMRGETDDRGDFRAIDSDPDEGLWLVPDDDGERNALDWHPLAFARTEGHERMAWPDFTDPATIGCLLALAREAWGRPIHIQPAETTVGASVDMWRVVAAWYGGPERIPWCLGEGRTIVEALVAALERAPERP